MTTLRGGTVQHQDLGALPLPPGPPYLKYKYIWDDYGKPTAWTLAITTAICTYNVSACALGRFFLDHFHLWNRTMPPDVPNIEKHAEPIVALLAGALSPPLTFLIFSILFLIDDIILVRGYKFRILDVYGMLVWIFIVALFSLLPAMAALIHLKFLHVTPLTTLAVFGFGSLVIFPSFALLGSGSLAVYVLFFEE
ncbi:hypothetical protein DL96DRAFT_1625114 [Flagelloscypha sp. PMI_526]|nr:hypothetical protein DL96DRAFT_1625114 [Flagelloscypha sp. PMI_526]